ncbi:co-chaperone DjlA [Halorhodospira halophila]|nr:co-chaperone DjlA [Halorhodospira halophila]
MQAGCPRWGGSGILGARWKVRWMQQPYRIVRRWSGRILATLGGWLIAGWSGAVAGLAVGTLIDLWVRLTQVVGLVWSGCGLARTQRLFLGATALTMGHLAKSDGRVSEQEIAAARRVLGELPLDERGRRRAITIFNRGKAPDAPLRPVLGLLRLMGRNRPQELARFLEFQLRVALADGTLDKPRERLLRRVWRQVGVSQADLDARLAQLQRGKVRRGVRLTLDHAYRLLGLSRGASSDEVRQAYRRAISQSHPDRLISRGVSQAELEAAGERTRQIRAAYETIREARSSS